MKITARLRVDVQRQRVVLHTRAGGEGLQALRDLPSIFRRDCASFHRRRIRSEEALVARHCRPVSRRRELGPLRTDQLVLEGQL